MGPFEVLSQYKNDVQVRHLSTGKISVVFISDLKPFRGTLQAAKALAVNDADQHLIDRIIAYSGDPLLRSSLQFLVRFADAQELWMTWNKDLQDSAPYEDYVRSLPALFPLIYSAKEADTWSKRLRKALIKNVNCDDTVRVDIRALGTTWYASLDLPDKHLLTYVVPGTFGPFSQAKKRIEFRCPLLGHSCVVDNVFIHLYCLKEPPGELIELNTQFVTTYPRLLSASKPISSEVADFTHLVGSKFFDPDSNKKYEITRIAELRNRDIVAYVRPLSAKGRPSKEDTSPFHIQDVIAMLAA
jgi:hypothetical protein